MKTLKLLMFFLMPWLVANLSLATTQLTLGGYTAPLSSVSGVEGGNIFFTTVSNTNGWFVSISTDDGLVGDHSIDIYSVDSSSFGTSITTVTPTCTLGSNTVLTNILLSPSISLVLPSVGQGYPLQLLGSAKPNCTVTISTIGPLLQYTTVSSTNGTWAYALDTTSYAVGDYQGSSVVEDSILGTSVNSPNVNFSVRASINWIGATDGDVTNPDNYDNGGNLPTAGDLVIYSAGTTPNTGIAPSGVNWVFGGGSTLDGATLFGDVLFSGGGGVNSGTITGFATFGDTCYNQGTVSNSAVFYGRAYNGNLAASSPGTVTGNAEFTGTNWPDNYSGILDVVGIVNGTVLFSGTNVVFTVTSVNWTRDASVWAFTHGRPTWIFNGGVNWYGGVVGDYTIFTNGAQNHATAGNHATFDNSVNYDGTAGSYATFSHGGYNYASGTVGSNAVFNDVGYNAGTVNGDAYFTGVNYSTATTTYFNPQQGTVSGNTIFSGANVVFTLVSGETWGVDASAWLFTNGVPSWAFGASSANGGVILGQATFDGAVNNSGAYAGNNDSFINSSQNSGIVGTNAVFSSAAQNIAGGAVGDYATFGSTTYNAGTVGNHAAFNDGSYTAGSVGDYAYCNGGSALIYGTVGNHAAFDTTLNSATVGDYCKFIDGANNAASVGNYASFWDTSYNSGSVGMYSYFTGSSYNNGTVDLYATFDSSAYNIGHVGDDFVNQSSSTISYAGYWGMTAPIPPASNVLYGVSFGQQQVGTMPAGSGGGINGSAILGMP